MTDMTDATYIQVARENVAKAVAHCGRSDIMFNALADAKPEAVVRELLANAMTRNAKVDRATVHACKEWLAANA